MRPTGRPTRRWKDGIQVDLQDMGTIGFG